MGRIDPAPPRPGRVARRASPDSSDPLPLRRSGRGSGPVVGCVAVGILAVALVAFVGYEVGKQAHSGEARVTVSPSPRAARTLPWPEQVAQEPPQGSQVQRVLMEVTSPPPLYGEPRADSSAESLHDKMARCLSFQAEDDEIHAVLMPTATQVRVTVTNGCDFSFAGSEVWFEARAIPNRGAGTSAREVGRFQTPIEARSRAETRIILSCPRCYAATHSLEASLWWASGGGRRE